MNEQKIPLKERVYLKDLHFDHELWSNELSFYKNELTIFNRRLEEIVVRYTTKEVLAKLEKYQNQFIRQAEVIDILNHEIKVKEQELARFAKENPVAIEHHYFPDHKELRDEFHTFKKIYSELKQDFIRFLSKYM